MMMFRKTNHKKWILIFLVIGIGWFGYTYYTKPTNSSNEANPTLVEVSKVKKGDISIEAHTVGTLSAAKNVMLSTEVAGKVADILVQDGSFVKKGQPLIRLDDGVTRLKAESTKANLIYAETNYHRMVILGKKGAISQQNLDQALAEWKDKKALAEENQMLYEKMTIRAPFDGVLGKIKVSSGEYVKVGEDIVTLTDTKNLRAEFSVSEKYLGQLKIGQQVTLTTSAYPGKFFYGKIAYIAPTINTEDRTISTYADVPNQDDLLTAGLFVDVTPLMGNKTNVMLVPAVSLVATIDGQQVYKVVDNKVVATAIKVGQRTENEVQILEGLKPNDTIVTVGQQKLKDGMPVKIKL